MAWLRLWMVKQDLAYLKEAAAIAEQAVVVDLNKIEQKSIATDNIGGVAGTGILLLRMWQATGDKKYLAAAVHAAEWLSANKIQHEGGTCWPIVIGDARIFWGFAHGLAGIAYLFALLQELAPDPKNAADNHSQQDDNHFQHHHLPAAARSSSSATSGRNSTTSDSVPFRFRRRWP